MARYKDYCYSQTKLIPVSFSEQILPGTFEYTASHLIDNELDLSVFDADYQNDETGAPAYDPRVLLKIVLVAYSRGIFTSRRIERACRENVIFMALSADTQPHWTTIADFISTRCENIAVLFREVLLVCDSLGLLGKELFAIDGCKLPSNAAKQWSGTHAQLLKRQKKLEKAIRVMLKDHRERDARQTDENDAQREHQYIATLRARARKIKGFLGTHDENRGPKGTLRQANITDPESAKMKTSHGVIQGDNGVAGVDAKHQVIVHAQAFGEGQEHALLVPMIEGTRQSFETTRKNKDIFEKAKLTADAGFHTEANMKYVFDEDIDAYIADKQFRKRDPRFAEADRYKRRERAARQRREGRRRLFKPKDFDYDTQEKTCVCPAGKRLYRSGSNVVISGYTGVKFKGALSVCVPCPLRAQCLQGPA